MAGPTSDGYRTCRQVLNHGRTERMDQGGDNAILAANTGTTYVDVDTQPGVQHIHGVSSRLTARLTSHWSGTGTSGPPIPWRSTPKAARAESGLGITERAEHLDRAARLQPNH